jgi:hypothetical protein
MEAVQALGCIACLVDGKGYYVAEEIHHVLSGGRRRGHKFVLPLCYVHHRSGTNNVYSVSRHPWKREFERRYGTEQKLLAVVDEMLSRSGHIAPDIALQS